MFLLAAHPVFAELLYKENRLNMIKGFKTSKPTMFKMRTKDLLKNMMNKVKVGCNVVWWGMWGCNSNTCSDIHILRHIPPPLPSAHQTWSNVINIHIDHNTSHMIHTVTQPSSSSLWYQEHSSWDKIFIILCNGICNPNLIFVYIPPDLSSLAPVLTIGRVIQFRILTSEQ